MEEKVDSRVLITNLTLNGDGFGVIPESGESVYFPPGVVRAADLIAGEYRLAKLVPNTPARSSNTPWMGVFVQPPEAEPPTADLQAVLDLFKDADDGLHPYVFTTAEVARQVGVGTMEARSMLGQLFSRKQVARADVYYGSEKRAYTALWAEHPDDFS